MLGVSTVALGVRMLDVQAEYNIPIPTGSRFSYKTYMPLRLRAEAACKSAIYLRTINPDLEDSEVSTEDIAKLIKKNVENVEPSSDELADVFKSPEASIRIHAIMRGYDHMIVENAVRIRNYVTNKLIEESNNADPKIRMQALIQLGKITDVGLFTERSEINVNSKSTLEITNTLREKLTSIINKDVEDANIVVEVVKEVDIEAEFRDII